MPPICHRWWALLGVPSDVSESVQGTVEPFGTVAYTVGLGDMGRIFATVISVCISLTEISAHI